MSSKRYPQLKEVEDVLGGAAAWENVDKTDSMFKFLLLVYLINISEACSLLSFCTPTSLGIWPSGQSGRLPRGDLGSNFSRHGLYTFG
jgi:hypothetical protein